MTCHFTSNKFIIALLCLLSFTFSTAFARTVNVRAKTQVGPSVKLRFKVGEKILVTWKNKWFLAEILKKRRGRYYIHYVGWDKMYDEWVKMGRMAKNCSNASIGKDGLDPNVTKKLPKLEGTNVLDNFDNKDSEQDYPGN